MNNEEQVSKPMQQEPVKSAEPRLVDVSITDENVAFNVMVNFIILAQKRGIFTLEESAKIWECMKRFQR